MNQNFKTLFFLKKGKGYKSGSMPVYVRVTINGKRAESSIQRSCEPAKWNQKKGRVNGTNTFASQLNTFLDIIQGKLFAIQQEHA